MTTVPFDCAFPIIPPTGQGSDGPASGYPYPEVGLSKREYMATKILAGMNAAIPEEMNWPEPQSVLVMARNAVLQADFLIAALNEVPKP